MNIQQSFRILFRNKTYSLLNILGLTVGITAAALIFLWVEYQMNFNRVLPRADNIYRIGQHQGYNDKLNTFLVAPGPLSRTLDGSFPEIKRNTRVGDEGTQTFVLENSNQSFAERGQYMDSTAFGMLDMEFIHGNAQTAFDPAFPIVISEKMSKKIFGNDNPVGNALRVDNRLYEITGVFKDLPKNISFQFEWLIPFRVMENDYIEKGWVDNVSWGNNWQYCYVELQPSADVEALNQKLKGLIAERTNGSYSAELFVYPITKLRLYGEFKDGQETGSGYIRTVRLFFIISLVIILIACINFMNLSTARSQKRALETGIRKTFGASRKKLMALFLGESGLMTLLAVILGAGCICLCLPAFNQLVSLELSLDFSNPLHLAGLLAVALVCTFLAGAYPAFYLSSFSPINTLKKQKVSTGSVAWIRKGLVIFQFAIAFILICATTVIYLQIRHAQQRDLGIQKENLITFGTTPALINSYSAVQNELQGTGFVESSGLSSQSLLQLWSNGWGYKWAGMDPEAKPLVSHVLVTPGLLAAAGLSLVSGSDFAPQDTLRHILVNQALADMMGDEGRIGGRIGQTDDPEHRDEIKGIVKDFVFNDVYRDKAEPVIFRFYPSLAKFLFVRLKPEVNQVEALAKIKSVLQQFSPEQSFDPTFMDDSFDRMFAGERMEGKLAALFAALAIFISCLGLFGLSAFSAEQRTREIGIRKVLGANISNILQLLGKEYMTLIGVSLVAGIPIAWYISNNYLKDYSYKIGLSWTLFAGVALLVILIAILTVSFQSLKAAVMNPVKSIKTE